MAATSSKSFDSLIKEREELFDLLYNNKLAFIAFKEKYVTIELEIEKIYDFNLYLLKNPR